MIEQPPRRPQICKRSRVAPDADADGNDDFLLGKLSLFSIFNKGVKYGLGDVAGIPKV